MASLLDRLFGNKRQRNTDDQPGADKKSRAGKAQGAGLKGQTSSETTSEKSARTSDAERQRSIAAQESELQAASTDQEFLRLAEKGITADLRQRAAMRIKAPETLNSLLKAAKGRDKTVTQIARNRINELNAEQQRIQNLTDRRAQVLSQIEELTKTENFTLFEARLQAAETQWRELTSVDEASKPGPEDQEKYSRAAATARDRLYEIRAIAEEEARQRIQTEERQKTLELLATELDALKTLAQEREPSLASLDALIRTQENRWLESTEGTEVSRADQEAFRHRHEMLSHYRDALQRYQQHEAEIQTLLDTAEADNSAPTRADAVTVLEHIAWPPGFARPDALTRLAKLRQASVKSAKASSSQSQDLKRLRADATGTLDHLETLLEEARLQPSREAYRLAQQQIQGLPESERANLSGRLQRLGGQLRELRDWQGFATAPKQIALCEQMEHLASQAMEPELKAGKIQELQQSWKDLGGSPDRELWQRFKAAADEAYEPCKAFFEAKSELKQQNLDKRQTICAELEHFLEAADWTSIDWNSLAKLCAAAKKEWRDAWPVDFRSNRSVQKRFDALIRRMEKPLLTEQQRNEALKADIVAEAQRLSTHEPLAEAIQGAKQLQSRWTSIGITRHKEDRALWSQFRTACDQIFARRDEQKHELQRENERLEVQAREELQALKTRLADIEALDGQSLSAIETQLTTLVEGKLTPSLSSEAADLKRQANQRQRELSRMAKLDAWLGLVKSPDPAGVPRRWASLASQTALTEARQIVVWAETACGLETPQQDQSLRMEIQVKRLQDGLSGRADQRDEMESLVACWCLNTSAEQRTDELTDRLCRCLQVTSGVDE